MRDCYHERDTSIGDFEVRDSGNNHLNEPRTDIRCREFMMKLIFSFHEKHQAQRLSSIQEAIGLFSDTLQLLRANDNYIRSEFEVANLPKTLNGPQGIEASKTVASIEMLSGLEKTPVSLRIIPI